jgi:transcriptional regulator with XRE-family HTH domain
VGERKTSAFGAVLKRLRELAGFTQAELAEEAGLHRFGIAKLEQGVRQPSWETVQALAKVLGVDCTAFAEAPAERPAAKPGRPKKADAAAPVSPAKGKKRAGTK